MSRGYILSRIESRRLDAVCVGDRAPKEIPHGRNIPESIGVPCGFPQRDITIKATSTSQHVFEPCSIQSICILTCQAPEDTPIFNGTAKLIGEPLDHLRRQVKVVDGPCQGRRIEGGSEVVDAIVGVPIVHPVLNHHHQIRKRVVEEWSGHGRTLSQIGMGVNGNE